MVIAAGIGMLIIFGPLMAIPLSFLLGCATGVLLGRCIRCVPELRATHISQFVLVLCAMVLSVYVSSFGGFAGLTCVLAGVGFLIMLLVPNMAHYGGVGLTNILDPQDWTSTEEEIALRPIRRLIDKDNYRQALAELEELLKKHKPTYEAVLTKAKLLHHIGRVHETVTTLLSLIELSHSTEQQLAVMENLAFLEEHLQSPPNPPASGTRRIQIHHELVLFQTAVETSAQHKEIPPGTYEVEEIVHRKQRWLKLTGEGWGNAEMCWEAILEIHRPPAAPPKKGLFRQIARMQQAITTAVQGKPRRQLQAEAQKLLREANQFIRCDDWQKALPLLQKASACDPDRYEIAYRWALAVRHTANDAATAEVVSRILQQSQWTGSEQHMLEQLKRPLAN
jgi:thioredoxin-like negative regulator of GroEL